MDLTLKDRVLILNTVVPQFDTRKNMELKVSIDSKIAISEVDQKRIVIKDMEWSNQYRIYRCCRHNGNNEYRFDRRRTSIPQTTC